MSKAGSITLIVAGVALCFLGILGAMFGLIFIFIGGMFLAKRMLDL